MPEVTVLTAVRNGAIYLPETIASIQAQDFEDWEYILVDDASTDETPRIIAEAARQDSRLKLIRRIKAGGPFVAANEGLCEARGTFIVRTDGDDISLPHRIQKQLVFLKANPGIRACATFALPMRNSSPILHDFIPPPHSSGVLKWFLGLRCALLHSSLCIERQAFVELGGYRELPLAQDYRLWCDLARYGWLAVIPEILVYWRIHRKRVSSERKAEQKALSVELVNEHLIKLTGEDWSPAETATLMAVGGAEGIPLGLGLAVLRRWDRSWMRDSSLTTAERNELAARSAFRRKRFIRFNIKRQPFNFIKQMKAYWFPWPEGFPKTS